VDTLADYEAELYNYIESNEPSIFTDLVEQKQFTDAIKEKLNKVLTSFGDTFKATKGLN
jgi:F-type H+-transporting ATPase subunit alpha